MKYQNTNTLMKDILLLWPSIAYLEEQFEGRRDLIYSTPPPVGKHL